MGTNASQGIATLVFLIAFTFLGWGLFLGGNILLLGLFVVAFVASIALFLRAKPLEHSTR